MKRYLALIALLLTTLPAAAQNLEEFEKRVTEFTLDNGLHFIILERHQAPVVSFYAYVDAGAVNDPGGKTGLAHMFEHMIGKGTTEVGTRNWSAEKTALERVEAAYNRVEDERRLGKRADEGKLKDLEAGLRDAIESANSFVVPNEFPKVIEEAGGVGFNAGTGTDQTVYFYSLPANRVELWFNLQSEWFRQPVYREFYKERDVVREERRMRVESSPQGKLQEAMTSTAFTNHYRTVVGWAGDIENLRAADAEWFHRTYYVPSNITIAIAGDVDPKQMRELAQKYYGRIPAGPPPPRLNIDDESQEGEKRVVVETPSQPYLMIGYKRPDQNHPDDPVFDVVSSLLSSGRTGMLYTSMVRDSRIALGAAAYAAFPSAKYSSLFLLLSVPNQGHTIEENEQSIYENIEKLKTETVDPEALQRVKTKIRAGLIRQLSSNSGLAAQLAHYHVNYGDWRVMFQGIELIEKVTAEDVQRVAKEYFKPSQRTVTWHVKPSEEEGK